MRVYKRGKTYWYDFQHKGIRHRKTTNRRNQQQAIADAKQIYQAVTGIKLDDDSEPWIEEGLPTITLKDAVLRWYDHYGRRLKDKERIRTNIEIMFHGAGDNGKRKWIWNNSLPLHRLTVGMLKNWINIRLSEGIAAATIRAEMSIVRRTVNRLHGEFQTPDLRWPSPREDRRLTPNAKERWLTQEEIDELRAYLDPSANRPGLRPPDIRGESQRQSLQDNYDLFEFMLYTGARPMEAMTLPWARVDLARNVMILRRTKTSVATQMRIPRRIRQILIRRRTESKSTWVFPDRANPVEPRRICRAIGNAMNALGFNEPWKVEELGGKAVLYTLRDTYASRLAQSGKHTLQEIALMLGHKSTRMTEKYARLVPSDVAGNIVLTLDTFDPEPDPEEHAESPGRID